MSKSILIVGAGFSGAVAARQLADAGHQVLVIDSRPHVAGNCHTKRDPETGIMEHIYGPHIFNTNHEEVWEYVNKHTVMKPFINRVKASIEKGVFSLPINLHTINQFFGKHFSPDEAKEFFAGISDETVGEPQTFEDQALKFLGKDLYEAFFKGYTIKQWGVHPRELPASILKRLPVRFNYDDNYYSSKWQGIPVDGYTSLIENIFDHPNIEIQLETPWQPSMRERFESVIYTGPIDQFYDYEYGKLGYRTVFWEKQTVTGDFQGNAVINYPTENVPYTRIHEHKHFAPWENHEKSIVLTEFSKETEDGETPYYPKRLEADKKILSSYLERAASDSGIYFLGRLATYRYMDMDDVIKEALEFSERLIAWMDQKTGPEPKFGNDEKMA